MEIRKFGTQVQPQGQTQVQPQSQAPRIQTQSQGGLVTPNVLDDQSVQLLTERIKDEYTAHYFYRNAANWCKNKNYTKAASFFDAEADSELEHAKGLQNYLIDFNIQPTIPQAETNKVFNSLVDIIGGAYRMEYSLMESYNQNSSALFTSDLTTFDFLQEYRKIQKDAVVEYSDLLNALQLIDNTDKFQILYFEQTYF
jgi:ferritin